MAVEAVWLSCVSRVGRVRLLSLVWLLWWLFWLFCLSLCLCFFFDARLALVQTHEVSLRGCSNEKFAARYHQPSSPTWRCEAEASSSRQHATAKKTHTNNNGHAHLRKKYLNESPSTPKTTDGRKPPLPEEAVNFSTYADYTVNNLTFRPSLMESAKSAESGLTLTILTPSKLGTGVIAAFGSTSLSGGVIQLQTC